MTYKVKSCYALENGTSMVIEPALELSGEEYRYLCYEGRKIPFNRTNNENMIMAHDKVNITGKTITFSK